MHTTYELRLPDLFQYTLSCDEVRVGQWIQTLLATDAPTRIDPVFAITVDFDATGVDFGPQADVRPTSQPRPVWRLWLSDSSYRRLWNVYGPALERYVDRRNLTRKTPADRADRSRAKLVW